jgi:hypothetical protein
VKKIFAVLAVLFVSGAVFAQINVPSAPSIPSIPSASFSLPPGINAGSWVDPNYNATWEITSDNIRILYSNGTVAFDFRGQIQNFKPIIAAQPGFSFSSSKAGRDYTLTIKPSLANPTAPDITLKIVRPNEKDYTVDLKKK